MKSKNILRSSYTFVAYTANTIWEASKLITVNKIT